VLGVGLGSLGRWALGVEDRLWHRALGLGVEDGLWRRALGLGVEHWELGSFHSFRSLHTPNNKCPAPTTQKTTKLRHIYKCMCSKRIELDKHKKNEKKPTNENEDKKTSVSQKKKKKKKKINANKAKKK